MRNAKSEQRLHEEFSRDARETLDAIIRRLDSIGVSTTEGREKKIDLISKNVIDSVGNSLPNLQAKSVKYLVRGMLDFEGFLLRPDVDLDQAMTKSEWVDLLDELFRQIESLDGFFHFMSDFTNAVVGFVNLSNTLFSLNDSSDPIESQDISDETECRPTAEEVLNEIYRFLFSEDIDCYFLLTKLTEKLHDNQIIASGGTPGSPGPFKAGYNSPGLCKGYGAEHIVSLFFGGTPFETYLLNGLRNS